MKVNSQSHWDIRSTFVEVQKEIIGLVTPKRLYNHKVAAVADSLGSFLDIESPRLPPRFRICRAERCSQIHRTPQNLGSPNRYQSEYFYSVLR